MIHDSSEGRFKNSSVPYTRFRSHGVRQMFAYLRDREDVLKRDISRLPPGEELSQAKMSLVEVESQLLWMFTNLKGAR